MALLNGPPREPSSEARSGVRGASQSAQAIAIVYALRHAGIEADPDVVLLLAACAAAGWGFVAGAIGKVCRDEMHAHETGIVHYGPVGRILLVIGSALG